MYINNVLRFTRAHQCIKIGKNSAMYKDWIYLSIVLVFGIFQQCNKVKHTTTMY